MTGTTEGASRVGSDLRLGSIDADTAERIDVHLRRAFEADDTEQKDFHVRHARQVLEGFKE